MNAASIGIIGGADGPTSIFIAGPDGGQFILLGALLAMAAVLWLLLRKKHHKKTDE